MKFIKNNFKVIIGIVIIAIFISGISVYATATYLASQVTYKDGKNVASALDELYEKSNKTSGELFLELLMKKQISCQHNYTDGYSAFTYINNLDFSNIKKITYHFNISTNNSSYQTCYLYDNVKKSYIFYDTTSNNATININGATDVNFLLETSFGGGNTFKVTAYETMDGIVHN